MLHRGGDPIWDYPRESGYYYCQGNISWVHSKDYSHLTNDPSWTPLEEVGGQTRSVTEASRAGTCLVCDPGGRPCASRGTGPMELLGSRAIMVARSCTLER